MPNGFSGVMLAVASIFLLTLVLMRWCIGRRKQNPQRDLPRGMILSLVICTIIYILLTLVLTGAVNHRNFDGIGDLLVFIFEPQNLNIGWMQFPVAVVAVGAMTSVLPVFFFKWASHVSWDDMHEQRWVDAALFQNSPKI